MSQSNPSTGDIVKVNDTSVGSKHGQRGKIVRVPNPSLPVEGNNRFKVQLDNGDTYVTRFAHELIWLEAEGGAATIPTPAKPVSAKPKVTEVVGNTIDDNKANAILTARVEAGKTISMQVKERIKPLLPAVVAEHADHPAFDLMLANLIAFSQKQFLPGNSKAAVVADCVMKSSMLNMGASFDLPTKINEIINGALDGVDFGKLGLGGTAATPEKK
jgi:hypothetical protein